LEMGIGVRLNPAQRHKISNSFGHQDFQRCPVCHVMMIRDVESSFESVCSICRTEFCWHCAILCSGKFGWRTDASAHEPTCVKYRHGAPGAEPLYVQRRLEEEKLAEEYKVQLCLYLLELLQWPSLLLKPTMSLRLMISSSSDNGSILQHGLDALSLVRRDTLDRMLECLGTCRFCCVCLLVVVFLHCCIFVFVG